MENKDKIYDQFKEAATKAEDKSFARMDAVWNRVEEKLDAKKERRTAIWWKYTGIAALFLLFMGIGIYVLNNNDPVLVPKTLPERNVTVIDTEKVREVVRPRKQEVVLEDVNSKKQYDTTNHSTKNKSARHTSQSSKPSKPAASIAVVPSIGLPFAFFPLDKENDSNTIENVDSSNTELSDVVVEGYSAKVKTQSNVAVTTVTSKTLEGRPNANVIQSLQGRVAGVAIVDKEKEALATFNPKYYANTFEILSTPDKKVVNGVTNMAIADVPNTQQGYLSGNDKEIETQLNKGVVTANSPNTTLGQTLQGQVPGLNIITGQGAPGANNKISIKGVSSLQTGTEPLYVIDGKIANAIAIRKIDSNNIESINVLKDANATSIYGSRAANGAVIITMKKLSRKQKRELKKAAKEAKKVGYADPAIIQFAPIKKIKVDQEEYESFEENKFENPATTPLSTFSIDVDNASYTNIRRFINNRQTVPKDAVRVEEMINFFKYSYPQPSGNDPFSINTEYSDAPWNPKHKLLKIGLQGRELPTKELPASNFVFLIDVSGSMSDANKLPLLKQSMKILVNQMRPKDRIAIVVYAGAAGLVLPSTSIADKDKIIAALDNLNAGGSTAGGEGIELAYKTALENFIKGGNNRVILATDGDFNVGASTDSDMEILIEAKRKSGVFLTCLGYGMGNYKDSKLETLADKGNGNYAYIDNMQEAGRFLDKEFKGSMYAIAKDVKIQIEFNPKHVQSYRLIGYENRKLRDEDFANDTVDAGELGSGHTVTALYEIIPAGVQSEYLTPAPGLKYSQAQPSTGNYNDELATIKFRHKKPDEDKSTEIIKTIPNTIESAGNTSADFKFAAAVAWFGLKLRDSKLIPAKQSDAIKKLAKQGLLHDPEGYRAEFVRLVEMVE